MLKKKIVICLLIDYITYIMTKMSYQNIQKGCLLYEGKAKRIYQVIDQPNLVLQEFKDSLTAFNGEKKTTLKNKGLLNHTISCMLFKYLQKQGLTTHFITEQNTMLLTQKLKMIPLEVVVRNKVAGSLKKRLGLKEGKDINPPLIELYFKSDSLKDPLINEDHALLLKATDSSTLQTLKKMALEINKHLIKVFTLAGFHLVDFKLEFGIGQASDIMLGDEISPDTCRIWDIKTNEKLDKDRFRFDLGDVQLGYQIILDRLQKIS